VLLPVLVGAPAAAGLGCRYALSDVAVWCRCLMSLSGWCRCLMSLA